jgi:hypothetical protein
VEDSLIDFRFVLFHFTFTDFTVILGYQMLL